MKRLFVVGTALDQADPRGRLDVAAFRILERLAERRAPAEWAVLRLLAAECCRRTLGRLRLEVPCGR